MKSKGILDEITRKTIARVLETDGFIGKMTANDILSALLAAEEEIEELENRSVTIHLNGAYTIHQLVADNVILATKNKELTEKLEDMRKYLDS